MGAFQLFIHLALIFRGLRDPSTGLITIEHSTKSKDAAFSVTPRGQTPRQLIGQPASSGLATGVVRCIYGGDDLAKFRQGTLLCRAS